MATIADGWVTPTSADSAAFSVFGSIVVLIVVPLTGSLWNSTLPVPELVPSLFFGPGITTDTPGLPRSWSS
jgi:hypothetical protein